MPKKHRQGRLYQSSAYSIAYDYYVNNMYQKEVMTLHKCTLHHFNLAVYAYKSMASTHKDPSELHQLRVNEFNVDKTESFRKMFTHDDTILTVGDCLVDGKFSMAGTNRLF